MNGVLVHSKKVSMYIAIMYIIVQMGGDVVTLMDIAQPLHHQRKIIAFSPGHHRLVLGNCCCNHKACPVLVPGLIFTIYCTSTNVKKIHVWF